MLFTTLIIVAVLLLACVLMSTESLNHLNRAAVAMCSGVTVWVVYMLHAGDYIRMVHPEEFDFFLDHVCHSTNTVKEFVANNIIIKYISEACSVILFLIATNTIVEVLHNNGVFDSLVNWLRMKSSRKFLWVITIITFFISANVDNLTAAVLMLGIVDRIVRSHAQRVIFACAIMVSATLGGCFTVIGDMTSLMLWVRGAVTASAFSSGLFLPSFTSLCVFNLLISKMLHGRVEVVSVFNIFDGDDSYLNSWQKVVLLVMGIGGLWFIPTFHALTQLPPFLGALSVLAVMWMIEGLFNLERNGNVLMVQRHYFRTTEFIGMRMILYFLGISLLVGAVTECGALEYVGRILESNVDNVYIYGALTGFMSSLVDNVPLMMLGINMFQLDTVTGSMSEFAVNGTYWQLLSFCCSVGGSFMFIGTLAGQAVLQVEHIRFSWMLRHYTWRVIISWIAGIIVFWLIH